MTDSPAPKPMPAAPDLTGRTVARYTIRERIGSGGMGEVYRAEDTLLKRSVALKRISPELRADPYYRQRFLKEAERASKVSDPHIAGIHDVVEENGDVFLVMEYVEGQTLRGQFGKPMPVREFLGIAVQCAEAMAAAHAQNLVHCDIKPENLIVTNTGRLKVLDFGVARPMPVSGDKLTSSTTADRTGEHIGGTMVYMAPETLLKRAWDARSDLWSLGVVFYEALSGQHPFRGETPIATCNNILHAKERLLTEVNPEVTADLERTVSKLLAKDPAERYASAADLLVDLRALQRGESPRLKPGQLDLRTRRGAGAVILLAILLLGGYQAWRAWRTPQVPPPEPGKPVRSIAILPFRNIGTAREYDYFGVGLSEVLNGKVTSANFFEVRSARGAWDPSRAPEDPAAVGKRLGVEAVLSGSYQIEAGSLSLSFALIDVQRNVQIAGDALQYPFTRAVDVEHRLAEVIVDSLNPSATQQERERFVSPATQRDEAFQALLRSNYEMDIFWRRPNGEPLGRARKYLLEALQLDPQFTLALVNLVRVDWVSVFWGYGHEPGVMDRASANASRAIALAPENGEAYAARALVEYQQGHLDKMRASLKEAFARTAHSPLAYYGAGYYYLSCGLADRSVAAFLRARELEPTLVRLEPGLAYRFQGEFQKSAQQLEKDLEAYPEDQIMTIALMVTRVFMGDVEGARRLEPKVLARSGEDPSVQAGIALLRAREGKPFPIDEWVRKYQKVYWVDGGYSGHVAAAYAMAGRGTEALRWLRRSGQLSFRNYVYLSRNPAYDNLRDVPEFKTYLETLRGEWEQAKAREEQDPLIPRRIR